MMKRKGSFILVMVSLVFLGGWMAKADPPATPGTDAISDDSGSAVPGSQQRFRHQVRAHEHGLQGSDEAAQRRESASHQHGPAPDTHMRDKTRNRKAAQDRVRARHETGMMAEPAGGMMGGNAPGQGKSMMGSGSGNMGDGAVPEMHQGDGMMGSRSHGGMMGGETQPSSGGGMQGGNASPEGGAGGGTAGGTMGGGG